MRRRAAMWSLSSAWCSNNCRIRFAPFFFQSPMLKSEGFFQCNAPGPIALSRLHCFKIAASRTKLWGFSCNLSFRHSDLFSLSLPLLLSYACITGGYLLATCMTEIPFELSFLSSFLITCPNFRFSPLLSTSRKMNHVNKRARDEKPWETRRRRLLYHRRARKLLNASFISTTWHRCPSIKAEFKSFF